MRHYVLGFQKLGHKSVNIFICSLNADNYSYNKSILVHNNSIYNC